jgi:hypothetical protein
MLALDAHPFAMEFRNSATEKWHLRTSKKDEKRKKVGEVRVAGAGKNGVGSYVFVSVHEAG